MQFRGRHHPAVDLHIEQVDACHNRSGFREEDDSNTGEVGERICVGVQCIVRHKEKHDTWDEGLILGTSNLSLLGFLSQGTLVFCVVSQLCTVHFSAHPSIAREFNSDKRSSISEK